MSLGRNLRFFLLIPLLIASGVHGDSDNDTGDVTDTNDVGVEAIFSPSVSATCRAGLMTIKVETNNNFQGAVHARDFRRPACTNYGEATTTTTLNINLLAERDTDKYCGVFVNKDTEERSVAIAVRMHKTLELADDKYYMITCGKAGFQNLNNKTSLVTLQLLREGRKVQQVVYGREYTLRAHISHYDGSFGMKVRRCFSFSDLNTTVELVDGRGCPDSSILSQFTYDRNTGTAQAKLFSMFKFPESNRVHFQCDIVICKGECEQVECPNTAEELPLPQARALQPKADAFVQNPEDEDDDGALMASYSVFVVDPGASPVEKSDTCQECTWGPVWLLYLCIAFGILFVVMLVINLFLCSAMSCACGRSHKEKEISYLEDFDPYARSWQGSQYGSRYSLSGGIKTVPVPYLPADTTRSVSSTSEYGASARAMEAVSVRPHSRTSRSSKQRGSPTTSGSTSGYSSSRHLVAK